MHCKLRVQCLRGELGGFPGTFARPTWAVQVFPLTQKLGSELKKAAQAVHEQTDRDDVRTMANMYSNNLESEMKRTGRSADVLALCERHSLAHGEQHHCDGKHSPGLQYAGVQTCWDMTCVHVLLQDAV